MVEPTSAPRTQLPATKSPNELVSAAEESKEEKAYMYGSQVEVRQDTLDRIEGIELNALESGLLNRWLEDPGKNRAQIQDVLNKLSQKHADDSWAMKKLNRVVRLYMQHEFWDT